MTGKLQDKVAIVTGSGRGIGQQVALRLARDGADVVVNDLDDAPAKETIALIAKLGRRAAACNGDVTAKDFRTWGGTMHAALALRAMGPAASRREADRNILAALEVVCKELGNTRTVCRKYYVHPALLEAYLMGRTVPLAATTGRPRVERRGEAALRRDEVAVLQFLQSQLE